MLVDFVIKREIFALSLRLDIRKQNKSPTIA